MALSDYKITTYTDNIADLPDRPELTAAQLKAKFDGRTDNEIKNSINGMCDALKATGGADLLGFAPQGDIPTDNDTIRKAIDYIFEQLQASIQDPRVIPNGSVTYVKLATDATQIINQLFFPQATVSATTYTDSIEASGTLSKTITFTTTYAPKKVLLFFKSTNNPYETAMIEALKSGTSYVYHMSGYCDGSSEGYGGSWIKTQVYNNDLFGGVESGATNYARGSKSLGSSRLGISSVTFDETGVTINFKNNYASSATSLATAVNVEVY